MKHFERIVTTNIKRLIVARARRATTLDREERFMLAATLRLAREADRGTWSAQRFLVAPLQKLKELRNRAEDRLLWDSDERKFWTSLTR